ncbi:hypothetical protein GGX14DRAFT_325472, partial [Mycena pura]
EQELHKAVEDIRHGVPAREAGARHGVRWSTAYHRAKGRATRQVTHEHQMNLTMQEEAQLVDDLDRLDRLGIKLTHRLLKGRAEAIRAERGERKPIGQHWVGQQFLPRHPEIRDALSRPKDGVRV